MTIEEEIGSGSYGTVYRVTKEGENLAMKVIRVSRDDKGQGARLTETESEAESGKVLHQISEDILKEIQALEKLQGNKNIVSILDYRIVEEAGGIDLYILMEYLQSFTEYESTHGMKEADAIRMGIDLCSALEACEEHDILHRDLKPDNILVTEDGVFKICDFGTAKILEKTHTENSVKGTFTYMAPEVYHGKKYNSRADLYSLGMILYRTMNRGREPFIPGDRRMVYYKDKEEALNRRMNGEVLPQPIDASEEFAEILARTCAFYPEKRYRSAADLKEDLIRLQNGKYRKKQRAGRYGKRDKAFYLKTAVIGLLATILLGAAGKAVRYRYLEYFVNYCDTDMQKEMMERYDLDLSARLTGTGVLYINSNEDLYCYSAKKLYPWMNQKDKIRKIIFGEAVSELNCVGISSEVSEYLGPDYNQKTQENKPFYSAEDIFRNCRNLEKIVIKSKRFVMLGAWIFEGDENLRAIECPEDTDIVVGSDWEIFQGIPWYDQQEVCMLGDRLVKYERSEEKVYLPDNIRKIGEGAFENNSNIKTVILPGHLEYIGIAAFGGCSSLERLVIPETATEIADKVFPRCSSLKELEVLPGNPSYKMVDGSLYDTEQNILKWCSPGTGDTVMIQEGTTAVGSRAFDECNAKKMVIPGSMTGEISYLGRMKNLEEICISDANEAYTLVDDILYYNRESLKYAVTCLKNSEGHVQVKRGTRILSEYCFASCKGVTSVTLPDTVEGIMNFAFENCSGLQSITIPASVTLMTTHVFDGCDSLTDIYFGGTEEEWRELADHYGAGVDEEKVTVHFG